MSDVTTNEAGRAPAGAAPALKRAMVRAGLALRTRIGEIAQSVADACAEPRAGEQRSGPRPAGGFTKQSFADLPAYRSISKHRDVGRLFGIKDPFYRCHGLRTGSETEINGQRYINFASYDYVGLNQHPAVLEAAKVAIGRYGTSVSASRIVAGERPLHGELEKALAEFYGVESAVAFVSGHATNVSTIDALMTQDDLIVCDELSHNSIIVGARLSRSKMIIFRHNDMEDLERILGEQRAQHNRALIIVEGLYSMDGDVADLPRLVELKEKYGAWLMVDEAHSLGVLGATGRGVAEHFGIAPDKVDIWMGTLSKALAACGGYIAGKRELIEILKFQAPGLVYSVGLSPPLAAAAATALRVLQSEPERVQRGQENSRLFLSLTKEAGLDTATSEGHAIISVIVGDMIAACKLADRMLARGFNVLPIIYPAVPLKAARLRFFITSEHTAAQIRLTVRTMQEELANLGNRERWAA